MSRQPWSAVLGTVIVLFVCSGAFRGVRIALTALGELRPSLVPALAIATLMASLACLVLVLWHLCWAGRLMTVRIQILCGRTPGRIARRRRLPHDTVRLLAQLHRGKRDHLRQEGFSGPKAA